MDELIETIRVACASDASDETKQCGAVACRTILTALEAKAGETLAAEAAPTSAPPPTQSATAIPPGAQIAALVGALKGMPPEQLLDMAIARLRAALPKGTPAPVIVPLKVPLIPIAPLVATTGSTEARSL